MPNDGDLRINGKVYDSNDLTFREERELRQIVRDHLIPPGVDEDDLTLGDILPATIYILHRRDNPDFTLEEALDLKPRDVLFEGEVEARPTPRGSSGRKKTPASSGSRS